MCGKIKKLIVKVHGFLVGIYLFPIKIYRRYISPLKGVGCCRFTPSCSAYAVGAVREWGIIIGTFLALFRLVRCNPFSRGGVDEVPKKSEVFRKLSSFFKKD